jgi:hypothetical protein
LEQKDPGAKFASGFPEFTQAVLNGKIVVKSGRQTSVEGGISPLNKIENIRLKRVMLHSSKKHKDVKECNF